MIRSKKEALNEKRGEEKKQKRLCSKAPRPGISYVFPGLVTDISDTESNMSVEHS